MAWDAATGEVIAVLSSPRHFGHARQPFALSKDDRTVAVSNDDHSISLWDVSEPELLRVRDELKRRTDNPKEKYDLPAAKPAVTMRGHGAQVTAFTFHPDGKTLASSGADGTIRVWDTVTGELRLTLETPTCTTLAFTPDGAALVSADIRGEVKVWRAAGK
jgi:WD40 repeat protein